MKTLLLPLLAAPLIAYAYPAKVVGVSDGDTIKVLTAQNEQVKIRISAIDAPEKAQAFGERSKQAMSDLCYGVTAEITPKTTDRYGRTVADVSCRGKDAGGEMVRLGMAWVYDKYAKGYGDLYTIQNGAKAARRGLWADASPTPPWEWRKAKRED